MDGIPGKGDPSFWKSMLNLGRIILNGCLVQGFLSKESWRINQPPVGLLTVRDTYHWPHIEHWEILEFFFPIDFRVTKRQPKRTLPKSYYWGHFHQKLTSHFVLLITWKAIRYLTQQLKRKPDHSCRVMTFFSIFIANSWSVSESSDQPRISGALSLASRKKNTS